MIAVLPRPPEGIERFQAAPWPFQQTFLTPLPDLERFVRAFLTPFVLDRGAFVTDTVVFEPQNLLQLLRSRSIPAEDSWHFLLETEGQSDIAQLLEAALSDWVDFLFVPFPESFALYADHDEFTTFYARSEPELNKLASVLTAAGFEPVAGYKRA